MNPAFFPDVFPLKRRLDAVHGGGYLPAPFHPFPGPPVFGDRRRRIMPGSRAWTINLWLLAGCSWFVLCCSLFGLRSTRADEPGRLDEPAATTDGVLVMRNGTVMAGTISQSDGWYEVRGKYGNVQVPAALVKMRCSSLAEAYLRLHELTVALHSANSHVTLAKWCVTNQLDKEAVQELNDALKLEPDRDDVQRMLRQVTESLDAGRKASPPRAESEDPVRTPRQEASATEEGATLGGLSLPNALHYTRRIQPLLVNTCATAGCHNRESRSGFQLSHVAPGKSSNRHASEANLAAVLEQIDLAKPTDSRLLTVPRGRHGRHGRPIFAGPRGDEQFVELESWVLSVARDGGRRTRTADAEGQRKGGVRPAAATDDDSAAVRNRDRDPFAGKPSGPAVFLPGEKRDRKFSDSDRGDPFDPAGFNRQASGGRSSR